MKATIKRIITKDVKTIEDLKKNNIYLEFDEENMLKAKALIIGPEDTIYFGGLYFFDIDFPNNYPHIPPVITYKSSSKVRIHPNLYVSGKVCLSVLGTWKGPPWTSSMDISCILLSIQSLLNNSPLINEPGFENYTGNLSTDYSSMVEYENIKHHFYRNTVNIPENFLMFQNIVNKNFIDNKDKILEKINENKKKRDNFPIIVNLYRIKLIVNYNKIYENIDNLIL
tara:strand:+ start:7473 stop:8150 length:678 start_codon:yes stop_codon:yes gene_type:complete